METFRHQFSTLKHADKLSCKFCPKICSLILHTGKYDKFCQFEDHFIISQSYSNNCFYHNWNSTASLNPARITVSVTQGVLLLSIVSFKYLTTIAWQQGERLTDSNVIPTCNGIHTLPKDVIIIWVSSWIGSCVVQDACWLTGNHQEHDVTFDN